MPPRGAALDAHPDVSSTTSTGGSSVSGRNYQPSKMPLTRREPPVSLESPAVVVVPGPSPISFNLAGHGSGATAPCPTTEPSDQPTQRGHRRSSLRLITEIANLNPIPPGITEIAAEMRLHRKFVLPRELPPHLFDLLGVTNH